MRVTSLTVSFVAALCLLSCCGVARGQQQTNALGGPVTDSASAANPANSTDSTNDSVKPAERYPRYRICLDDVLTLTFPLETEFNQKVTVQPDGFIALQGAGSIHVVGLTVPELAEAVKKAYTTAHVLHDPIVDVDLNDFQKPFFTVLGQVGKPGQYDLRYDITVTQAVAVAGGFSSTAKTQVFLYRSVSNNWAEVRELKIKDVLQGKNIEEDIHLHPGDMIFVPEKTITKFRKYVPYGVGTSFSPYPSSY